MARDLLTGVAIGGLSLLCGVTLAGEFEIRYDDGTAEASYYAVSAGDAYAVKFVAPIYPCTLLAARYFITGAGDPTMPFQAVVLDDGGAGSAPGCTLATVDFVSADTGNIWVEVELPDTSSLLFIDSTSFYVAMYWYTPCEPSLGGDFQFSGGDTLSWRLYSGVWYNLGGLVDLMIRAIVSHPDSMPPSLSGTTSLGDTTSCGPFSVSSVIVDDWVGVDPSAVYLFWRTNGMPWDSVNMLPIGGDTFECETPRFAEGDSVWYYLRASDLARNVSTDPPYAPDSSFSFLIITEPPQFSSTTIWPDTSFPGPYLVVTSVRDEGSGLDTTSIRIYWRFDDTVWDDTCMIWHSASQRALEYIPTVPDPGETTAVDYYLEAYDLIGLRGTDPDRAPEESTYHFVFTPPVGVEMQEARSRTHEAGLLQNFPNPFTTSTSIRYRVSGDGRPRTDDDGSIGEHVNLSIYNLAGNLVRVLVDVDQPPGSYSVIWDGKSATGGAVSAGVYLYRLEAGLAHQAGGPPETRPSKGTAGRRTGRQAGKFASTKKMIVLK